MSLSILNNIPAMQAQNQLTQTNASLQKTLFRLASGSKLNSGADDAAGLSIANGLSANVAALTQSAANASIGVGELQTADGALSQVTTLLNRAVTLATEASTSTVNGTQAASLNTEFQSIKAEIDRIGGKTTFNNQNVFGASNQNQWTGGAAMAAVFAAGDSLMITDSKSGKQTTFTSVDATAGTNTATAAKDRATMVSNINAAGLNVKASLSATNALVLTDTSGANAISVKQTGTTNVGALAMASVSTTSTVSDPNNWASTAGTSGSKLDPTATLTSGKNIVIYDADTQQSHTFATTTYTTLNSMVTAINSFTGTNAQSMNATASLDATTGNLQIKDNNGNGSLYITSDVDNLGSVTDQSTVSIGATASVYLGDGTATTAANTISTTIKSLSATADLGLSMDLTSTQNAQAALTQITSAIANIAQQRGVIGASINRLNAATNVINNQIENLTSAQSNISAADISAEVSNMTKYNVLTQTGISALSQSNQMQQALLKLLQ